MKQRKISKTNVVNFSTYLGMVIFFLVMTALSKAGVLNRSMTGLLVPICCYMSMAVSLNLTVGILGELSLGHAGFMSVGAFAGVIASQSLLDVVPSAGLRLTIAMIVGALFATIAGFIVGAPVLRLQGDYLAIVTLAFGEIIKELVTCLIVGHDENGLHILFNLTGNKTVEDLGLSDTGIAIIKGAQGTASVKTIASFTAGFILVMVTLFIVLNLKDAVLTVPQYIPQSAPLGEGDGGARHHKERPLRKVFTDGGGVTVQHRCMPHANGYNFFRPPGKGFHNGHLLERRLALVFLHAVRGGADAQKQCDLLNEPHQSVLSAVSGRAVILALDAVKLLQHDIVDLPLLREKRNRHLMDTADVLSRDLFKGAGDDRLSQQPIQLVGVVDVLISLSHAKDGDFLRQMGVCEQAVALFISGNRHSVIGVFLVLHIFRPLIVAVKRSTP